MTKKTIIILTMCLLLFATFQACGPTPTTEKATSESKLVIYVSPLDKDIYDVVAKLFTDAYPEVELEYVEIGGGSDKGIMEHVEEYADRVLEEIEAGQGPDVIFATSLFLAGKNTYELMDAGYFLDLEGYFANDEDYNPDDYVQLVMDAGVYAGGRFIVPVMFGVPTLVGIQEALDTAGLDIDNT